MSIVSRSRASVVHQGRNTETNDYNWITKVLFCSLAILDPRVGHTTDVLSPFIPVLWHSDWFFHGESCPRLGVVHPGRAWPSSPNKSNYNVIESHRSYRRVTVEPTKTGSPAPTKRSRSPVHQSTPSRRTSRDSGWRPRTKRRTTPTPYVWRERRTATVDGSSPKHTAPASTQPCTGSQLWKRHIGWSAGV